MTTSILIGGIVFIILVVLFIISYVKAPPSQAFLISGISKEPRVLIGKGGFRIPFLERLDKVYLGQITVDINTETSVPTNDFIDVDVDAIAKVRVDPTQEGIRLAGKNFLNMSADSISEQLKGSLQGNMREIIGTLELKELNTNRDGFSDQVMSKAKPDMAKLGIEILSCNIQNINDKDGLIRDLGADNTAKIKKTAQITKIEADKEVNISNSRAKKEANDARIEAETEILKKNNEFSIKSSELKILEDVKKAEADAAYKIQEQEQRKMLNIKEVDAEIEKTKREQVLSNERILITQNELTASINKHVEAKKYETEKKAEADKFEAERLAEAELERRKRVAEAEKYEVEKKAEAMKAEADAIKYKMLQESEGIKAKGEAEAFAIEKKGIAEAEAMSKKAEAYKQYNGAAVAEMMIKILPEMAANIAKPLSSIDSVRIYGTGQNGEVSGLSSNVPVMVKQVFDTLSEATGVNMQDILKSGTIEAATTRNINLSEKAEEVKNNILGRKEKKKK